MELMMINHIFLDATFITHQLKCFWKLQSFFIRL